MKKNFFKKLSFVLALAMIVSTIAPAAGAFAAAKPALSTTSKTLLLGEAGSASYDFNFKKGTVNGMKGTWSSTNTKVAKVDAKTGLTKAVAAGSATIKCKVTKNGKTVATVSAKVTVKSNMKTIAIADPGKVSIDKAATLAYTYKTYSGATKGSTSVVKWSVDKTGATVTDKGVFTATAPGTYVVTAKAYTTSTTTAVKATGTVTIKVDPSIVGISQYDVDTFKVTFDTDMSKSDLSATTATVYKVIGSTKVSTTTEKIKAVSYDTTGKIATIDFFAPFAEKTEYDFVYGTLTDKFTSAEVKLANIKTIEVLDTKVDVTSSAGANLYENVVAKDASGVIIYTGKDSDFGTHLSYDYKGDLGKGYVGSGKAYIYVDGYTTTVAVKYSNYLYNDTTKLYELVEISANGNLIGYKPDTNINTSTIQYVLLASGTPGSTTDWSKTSFALAANDPTRTVFMRYKRNNDADNYVTANLADFEFTTSDTDKLLITGDKFTPIKAGEVTVVVKTADTKKVLGAFTIVVGAARSFAAVTLDSAAPIIGNNATYGETGTVKFTAKDSMNDSFVPTSVTFDVTSAPAGGTLYINPTVAYDPNTNQGTISFNSKASGVVGSYTVKATINGYNSNRELYFNVSVGDGRNDLTIANYAVVLGTASKDLKDIDGTVTNDSTIDVYGLNAAGFRVYQVDDSKYVVAAKLNGNSVSTAAIHEGTGGADVSTVAFTYGTTPKTVLEKGNYQVTATVTGSAITGRAVGAVIAYTTLTVSDTSTYEIAQKASVVKQADITAAGDTADWIHFVAKAFTVKMNGKDVFTDAAFTNLKYKYTNGSTVASEQAGVNTNGTYYLEYVKATYKGVEYTFNIGKTFSVQN